jgi:hypothetical protein
VNGKEVNDMVETKKFKEALRKRACPDAYQAFIRSHTTPKKWAERVFRIARVQVDEIIELGANHVWYETSYVDGEFRSQLGWVKWVLNELHFGSGVHEPKGLKHLMFKVKDPYALLLKYLS